MKPKVGGKKLYFKWALCPELTLQFKAWWFLDLGGLCHWAPWHDRARAAARSGDINRKAKVQTLLGRALRDPFLLTIAVVCLQTSTLSLQFFSQIAKICLCSSSPLLLLQRQSPGWLFPGVVKLWWKLGECGGSGGV